jgi:hypothetical protein
MSKEEDKILECTSQILNQLTFPNYKLIFHEQINYARFDICTVALFGIQVFWDMTVSLGKWFLMFQIIMVPSPGWVKSSWTAWPLQMKAT